MSYTKVSDLKELCSLIRVYTVCHSATYFKKQLHKKQNLAQKVWNKVVEIFRTFTVSMISPRSFHRMCQPF